MQPKVSVIVPVYNAEKYLRECLDSIANQTLSDIQVLMIDDGSTDSSAEICKEYANNYEGFEYHHKENGGTATARNLGLKNAKGEYIGFVDSDDYIEPVMYELMYSNAKKNEADIVFAIMHGLDDYVNLHPGYYDENSIVKMIYPQMIPHIIDSGTFRALDWGNCSRIFRNEIVFDNNIIMFEGSRRCEDFAFCVECTLHANSYVVIDEGELYHYRPNENSKTHSYSKKMWQSIRALMLYMQGITENYMDYDFREAMDYCTFYFSSMVVHNEIRNKNRTEIKMRIAEVLNDDVCVSAVNSISDEKMNGDYSRIYYYMKAKDDKGLLHYLKRKYFKRKYIVPITNRVFQNKAILELYIRIRGK